MSSRVVVVTTGWGDESDERHLVIRQVAAALALGTTDPVVLHLGQQRPRSGDGAFDVIGIPATAPHRRRSRLLEAALRSGDIGTTAPAVVQQELVDLAGGVSNQLGSRLGALNPAIVVLAGYRAPIVTQTVNELGGRCRTVLVPLAGDDPFLSWPVFDPSFNAVRAVATATPAEQEAVATRPGGASHPCFVGFSLQVDRLARDTAPAGLDEEDFILALTMTSSDPTSHLELLGRYLHDQLPVVPMVIISSDYMLVTDRNGWEERPAPRARMDLWRLINRARVTVDLRPSGFLGREALESMMLGTPVVVRARGAAREHAEQGNGGLWWRSPRELVECVRTFEDNSIRGRLAEQGRSYAWRHFGDPDAFVRRVRSLA